MPGERSGHRSQLLYPRSVQEDVRVHRKVLDTQQWRCLSVPVATVLAQALVVLTDTLPTALAAPALSPYRLLPSCPVSSFSSASHIVFFFLPGNLCWLSIALEYLNF